MWEMSSSSATRRYLDTDLPRSAVARLFLESAKVVERAGLPASESVQVFIVRPGGINEHTDWPLDKLFAVMNLGSESLNSIRLTSPGPAEFSIELSRSFGDLSLMVIAPTAQCVAEIVEIADKYLPVAPAAAAPTPSVPPRETVARDDPRRPFSDILDWLEQRPLYRIFAIIGAIGGGIAGIVWLLRVAGVF
jgi:hypothetical protein